MLIFFHQLHIYIFHDFFNKISAFFNNIYISYYHPAVTNIFYIFQHHRHHFNQIMVATIFFYRGSYHHGHEIVKMKSMLQKKLFFSHDIKIITLTK